MAFRRAVTEVPRSVLRRVGVVGAGALDNALTATAALAGQIADRHELEPVDGDGDPGQLARLDRATCLQLLVTRRVGRLAYVARAGTPDVVPVNYAMDGEDVVFRSGPGPKLQAAERRELVAFEVDDIDEEQHTGWSVVVVGRARRVPAVQEGTVEAPLPWAVGPRQHVVRIVPVRIDGRRLR